MKTYQYLFCITELQAVVIITVLRGYLRNMSNAIYSWNDNISPTSMFMVIYNIKNMISDRYKISDNHSDIGFY